MQWTVWTGSNCRALVEMLFSDPSMFCCSYGDNPPSRAPSPPSEPSLLSLLANAFLGKTHLDFFIAIFTLGL